MILRAQSLVGYLDLGFEVKVFSTPVTYISSAAGITGVNQNH